jgi:hypothetical protein
MKKIFNFNSISIWLKNTRASKKLSRQSVDYLYTPIIAIILFMMAMFTILWSLSKQESDQAEIIFYREVAYAEQRLLLNFEQNEEELLLISKKTLPIADQKLNKELIPRYKFLGDGIEAEYSNLTANLNATQIYTHNTIDKLKEI